MYTNCTPLLSLLHSIWIICKVLAQTRSLYTHPKSLNMTLNVVRFSSVNVLTIAIAILHRYFERLCSRVRSIWFICKLLVQTRSLYNHPKCLNMSLNVVQFSSANVLTIAIAILFRYFEQLCSCVHELYTTPLSLTFNLDHLQGFSSNQKFVHPSKEFKHDLECCPV